VIRYCIYAKLTSRYTQLKLVKKVTFNICLFGFGNLHANYVQVCIALVQRFVKEKMKLATVLQILFEYAPGYL
jgi:hypothetical protein